MPAAEPVQLPDAPLARADATRRWALRLDDGRVLFAGLARPEARVAAERIEGEGPGEADRLAVAVELPVALSDGAGPHLLCADGALALALGPHPRLPELFVAMGEPRPRHRVGAVERVGGPLWRWRVAADVEPEGRIAALDALAEAGDADGLAAWQSRLGDAQ